MKKTVKSQAMLDNEKNLLSLVGASIEDGKVTYSPQSNVFIVLDVETTGLNKTMDKIVQFSAIKYEYKGSSLTEVDRLDQYINQPMYDENKIIPGKNGDPDKTFKDLIGITNEMLEKAPSEAEAFPIIEKFIGEDPIFICYNTPFDYEMVSNMYLNNGSILKVDPAKKLDVLVMAKDLVSKDEAPTLLNDAGDPVLDSKGKEKKTYKLSYIANLYGLDTAEDSTETITFHSSINDVVVTGRLLNVFIMEYIERKIKESTKPVVPKHRAQVKSVSYFQGYRGFNKYYVNAILDGDLVAYAFDLRKKEWSEKDPGTIDRTDFDLLKQDAFDLCGVANEEEFAKMKIEKVVADATFLSRYK